MSKYFVFAGLAWSLAGGTSAAPTAITDATSWGAVADGAIGAAEYAGHSTGIGSGFGNVIGAGTALHVDADVNGRLGFGFQLGAGAWNDDIVLYIDSEAGGFAARGFGRRSSFPARVGSSPSIGSGARNGPVPTGIPTCPAAA